MNATAWISCLAVYLYKRMMRERRYSRAFFNLIEAARELRRLNDARSRA